MALLGEVVAGCSPTDAACAAGSVPSGLDGWFVSGGLLLVAASLFAAVTLVRRWKAGVRVRAR